jgi:hypothetical protein
MPPAGFELTIPAYKQQQNHASDCAETRTGYFKAQPQQFHGKTKVNNEYIYIYIANKGKIYETMRLRTTVGANFTERNDFRVRPFLRIVYRLSRNSRSLNLLRPQAPVRACIRIAVFFS